MELIAADGFKSRPGLAAFNLMPGAPPPKKSPGPRGGFFYFSPAKKKLLSAPNSLSSGRWQVLN
jgi:hypothetical protein